MDHRRLNTLEALDAGILSKPRPTSPLPEGREWVEANWDSEYIGDDKCLVVIRDETRALESSNYYGIPHVWKDGASYRGILLQYRAVTEDETFTNECSALEWFKKMCAATSG